MPFRKVQHSKCPKFEKIRTKNPQLCPFTRLFQPLLSTISPDVKTENRSMQRRNQKHSLKIESAEDQTIKLSDDEDKAKLVCIKSEDVTNDEEL